MPLGDDEWTSVVPTSCRAYPHGPCPSYGIVVLVSTDLYPVLSFDRPFSASLVHVVIVV